jgi:integrase
MPCPDGKPACRNRHKHAHRVLQRALRDAVTSELVARNVCQAVRPPRLQHKEATALTAKQLAHVLESLKGHTLFPIVNLALGSGARRGELLALPWSHVNFENCTIRIDRSLEETRQGLHFRPPKNRYSKRVIDVPASVLEPLRAHRKQQLENRMALGLGRPDEDSLVFCRADGSPMSPDNLSRDWRVVVKTLKLPRVTFHGLRHTHVSLLIAAGLDVTTIARRLGHGSPHITLSVYAHWFTKETDTAAVKAIEAALRATK